MAYPPVPGWLPRPSAKLQSTWLSGRARLSTVSPSRYYQSETFEWRRHCSTAASISRRNDGASGTKTRLASQWSGFGGRLKDDVVYSSLSLTTIPEREYGRQN